MWVENYEQVSITPIPKRIREARSVIGISQRQLGVNIGLELTVASSRMNQYEQGKRVPDFGTLELIAEALDVPVAYFFCKDDKMAELVKLFDHLSDEDKDALLTKLKGQLPDINR